MPTPIVIDLFCGRFGWSKGFVDEGYHAIGFDLNPPIGCDIPPGCELIQMDVAKLCGYDLRAVNPTVIVASPPCQRYSYMAMPWDRAKREMRWQEWQSTSPFSPNFDLNDLFNHCFRIAREAGCRIVTENVRGAQRWVGPAKARYGSYYLWGNIASVGNAIVPDVPRFGCPRLYVGSNGGRKNDGGSWFNVAHNTESGAGRNPVNGDTGIKRRDADGYDRSHPAAFGWKAPKTSSNSKARKAASAAIAEIPFELSSWIAKCFKP